MKTAIYIEDGITQLVLVPESETDKSVLDTMSQFALIGEKGKITAHRGGFVLNRLGYRNTEQSSQSYSFSTNRDAERSLILVLDATHREPKSVDWKTIAESYKAKLDAFASLVRWMLGEEGEFPAAPAKDKLFARRYWWRRDLRQRFEEIVPPEAKEDAP